MSNVQDALEQLLSALETLDEHGEFVAAAHVATAIHALRQRHPPADEREP